MVCCDIPQAAVCPFVCPFATSYDICRLASREFINNLKEKLNSKTEIIKVFRVGNQTIEELQKTINQQPETINYFLFDTDSKAFGGTGKTFDWQILNHLEIPKPYFLSGGISLENIQQLNKIQKQPFALDINSKFETEPGVKDLGKIKKLITIKNEKTSI